VERAEADAIYDAGREAVVRVLLGLSAQNERLAGQVERLTSRVEKLERQLAKDSRNSSQPPSADRPGASSRRGKDPSGRARGAQPGHEGKGRDLLPTSVCDEVIVHWPTRCECGHEFAADELVAVGSPVRHQVEELPMLGGHGDRASVPKGALPGLRPLPACRTADRRDRERVRAAVSRGCGGVVGAQPGFASRRR
jgi:hypothetical protein